MDSEAQQEHAPTASVEHVSPSVKVVGYDGSANGRAVVAGAARRAEPGDCLIVVRAVDGIVNDPQCRARYYTAIQDMQTALGPNVLGGIDHELRVVAGRAARALTEVAVRSRAAGIVIGTRRTPSRIGQRTIRAELEAGPVPVIALFGAAQRESHRLALPMDASLRDGFGSFPASDPPSSWVGGASEARSADRRRTLERKP